MLPWEWSFAKELDGWMNTLQQTSAMEMVVTYHLGDEMK